MRWEKGERRVKEKKKKKKKARIVGPGQCRLDPLAALVVAFVVVVAAAVVVESGLVVDDGSQVFFNEESTDGRTDGREEGWQTDHRR